MAAEPEVDLDLIGRYLVPGERVVIAVRHHWVVVAEPVLTAIVSLALVLWVGAVVPGHLVVVADALWWVWFAVLARTLFHLWEWRRTWFISTDRRVLLNYGVIIRRVAMMPLGKVTDLNYGRSVWGRLLGYGTFTMESAGQNQALSQVDHIPNPDENYRRMVSEIFRDMGDGDPQTPDREDEGPRFDGDEIEWPEEDEELDPTDPRDPFGIADPDEEGWGHPAPQDGPHEDGSWRAFDDTALTAREQAELDRRQRDAEAERVRREEERAEQQRRQRARRRRRSDD